MWWEIGCATLLLALGMAVTLVARRPVPRNTALLVYGRGDVPRVCLKGWAWVWPIFERTESVDLTVHVVRVKAAGRHAMICQDYIRAEVTLACYVCIPDYPEAILHVVRRVGADNAMAPETLESLFVPKVKHALKFVGPWREYLEHARDVENLRNDLLKVMGQDHHGHAFDDVVVERIAQAPLSDYEANDLLGAKGLRHIQKALDEETILRAKLEEEKARVLTKLGSKPKAD